MNDYTTPPHLPSDPNLWLEAVDDPSALEWVGERNQQTVERFTETDSFKELRDRILAVLDSTDRIPYVMARGNYLYNFWQDAEHVRGIWRRTTLDEYRKKNPDWEVLLDIDALAEEESADWVYAGSSILRPTSDRALVNLSRGGGDATVVREFDLNSRSFVEGGFTLPEAKSDVAWAGRNKLLIGTDFGPNSMTDSGYPMTVRVWERGTSYEEASEIFRGVATDVAVHAISSAYNDYSEYYITRMLDFYTSEEHVYSNGALHQINKPDSANAWVHRGRLMIRLKDDWPHDHGVFKAGSLLIGELDENLGDSSNLEVLFEPSDSSFLVGWDVTKNSVLLSITEDVRTKSYVAKRAGSTWNIERITESSGISNESVGSMDPYVDDRFMLNSQSFLEPAKESLGNDGEDLEILKSEPAFFDGSNFDATQHWTDSKDGTRIPYYEVRAKDADKAGPTLLYGYGGFEASLLPQYSPGVGIGWLERGGTYVIANIRGGGEFGPNWHRSALLQNRNRAYEDFIAVAEDLVRRGVTSERQLGIQGGSNGGLLMGNMYTMRPDLFGAIACQVPLLDMSRYHLLLAGASWMAEYGNPEDPEQWLFLKNYSPYHNVEGDGTYPPMLITTSTRDDRVHPGHARKMTARLEEMGHTVHYYENTAGGHAGAADNSHRAFMTALVYEFLWEMLNKS